MVLRASTACFTIDLVMASLGSMGDQIFGMLVDFLSSAHPGLIPELLTPFGVPLHKGGLAHAPNAIHVPKGRNKNPPTSNAHPPG